MPTIFIAGDSWGCGEWNAHGKLNHGGIEQYFTEAGYKVVNSSVGGYSNENSIYDLEKSLQSNTSNSKIILWIQTDPIRDLRPFWKLPDNVTPWRSLTAEIKIANGFNQLSLNLLNDHYQSLNAIGKKYDTSIHLIGGKQDIVTDLLNKYNYLNALVPSWTHLLVGHISKYSHLFPKHTMTDYTIDNIDLTAFDTELRHRVVNEMHRCNLCWQIYDEQPIFHPDGQHPNREGHKQLFDYIIKELNL